MIRLRLRRRYALYHVVTRLEVNMFHSIKKIIIENYSLESIPKSVLRPGIRI